MKSLRFLSIVCLFVSCSASKALAWPAEHSNYDCQSTIQGIWLKPGYYPELIEIKTGGAGGSLQDFYTSRNGRSEDRLIVRFANYYRTGGTRYVATWPNGQTEGFNLSSMGNGFQYTLDKGGYLRCKPSDLSYRD